MISFSLEPGALSKAVMHRTVEEIWYVAAGQGRLWRKHGEAEQIVDLAPGLSLTIPVGTRFQFRNDGAVALQVVAVTMPPWPGELPFRLVTRALGIVCGLAIVPDRTEPRFYDAGRSG
jgi:mannose-6-phosphate isomerase-like protein (cupin superfamily)